MKVLVIGANGRVGRQLTAKLLACGHEVFAGARKVNEVFSPSVYFERIDLLDDVDKLVDIIKGKDAVYFVSGSRGKSLLQIDLHGAVKTMQAAEKAGVKRYIMLSSVFALSPERWNESYLKDITEYNIAKHYADLYLINNTKLEYTILQPGALKEGEGTGQISVNVESPGDNTIANVVTTLAMLLDYDNTIGKVITMHDGTTSITEALQKF